MTARDPLKGSRLGKRRQWGGSLGWGGTTQGVGGGQWALAGPQESCVCPAEDLGQVVLWGPLEEPEQGRGSPGCGKVARILFSEGRSTALLASAPRLSVTKTKGHQQVPPPGGTQGTRDSAPACRSRSGSWDIRNLSTLSLSASSQVTST